MLAALLVLALAVPSPWAPEDPPGSVWTPVSVAQPPTADLGLGVLCVGHRSAWVAPAGEADLNLTHWDCPDGRSADKALRSNKREMVQPSVFGPGRGYSDQFEDGDDLVVIQRWAQGNSYLQTIITCRGERKAGCAETSATVTQSFSESRDGTLRTERDVGTRLVQLVLTSILVFWFLFVGILAFAQWLRRGQYPLPIGLPGWTDVGGTVRRLRRRSLLWGVLVGIRRTCYVLFSLSLLGAPVATSAAAKIVIVGLITLTLASSHALRHPAFIVPRPRWWDMPTVGAKIRGVLGLVVRGLAHVVAWGALVSVLTAFIFEALGGTDGELAGQALSNLNSVLEQEGQLDARQMWITSILLLSDRSDFVAFLMFLVLAVCYGVDRLGQRLLKPSVEGQLASGEPEIVYLRDFHDDKVKIRASRISRRGVLGRLSPFRRRPFDEVVLSRLRAPGVVHGLSSSVWDALRPGIGGRRFPNDPDVWRKEVAESIERALFVVVSATPSQISEEGLGWEIDQLGSSTGHQRIMLVIGPLPPQQAEYNFHQFCLRAMRWRLFGDVARLGAGATCVLTHVTGRGWRAWGASSKSEWSYAAAIHAALDEALPAWREEHDARRSDAQHAH